MMSGSARGEERTLYAMIVVWLSSTVKVGRIGRQVNSWHQCELARSDASNF